MIDRAAQSSTGSVLRCWWLLPCLLGVLTSCGRAIAQETPAAAERCESSGNSSAEISSASSATVSPMLLREMETVRAASFPELRRKVVRSRSFESSADYFRARFSVSRFLLLQPMHYFVEMNPRIEHAGPSAKGACGILAHELVHISRMSKGNRIHLLGFVRLISGGYTARFERSADLEAIRLGYGPGLVTFREWVYRNIPANAVERKRRNYFSPEEIAVILEKTRTEPELFAYWNKHVPLNLQQIEKAGNNQH